MHHKSRLSARAWKVQRNEVSSAFRGKLGMGIWPWECVCVHACVSQKDLGARRGPRRCCSKAPRGHHQSWCHHRGEGPRALCSLQPSLPLTSCVKHPLSPWWNSINDTYSDEHSENYGWNNVLPRIWGHRGTVHRWWEHRMEQPC